jgi:tripartite-type tricarboxylate transporter receptor subunit TctC
MKRIHSLAAAVLACAAFDAATAQDFPSKPIRVVVPYAVGGADTYIRPLQPALEKKHGITLVIESVVGAGGTVGAAQVKRSAADGYTLLFCGSGALTIAPKLQPTGVSLADFSPVLNLVSIPYIVAVRKDTPFSRASEFVDHIKRNPGKLSYGSPGTGSAPHLAMEAMVDRLGTRVTHVPFSGIAPAVTALVGGHIDAVIGAPSVVMPQVRAGNLVAVAVSSRERFAPTPELPTLAEAGAPVDVVTNFGFLAPKGTPKPVIDKLAAALRDAAGDPVFVSAMEKLQNRVNVLSADEFGKALAAESAAFDPVIAKLPKQ